MRISWFVAGIVLLAALNALTACSGHGSPNIVPPYLPLPGAGG